MGIERRLISEMFTEISGLMHIQYAHDNHSDLDMSWIFAASVDASLHNSHSPLD